MDLAQRTILILGGSGLVGRAVARRLLASRPARLVLVALREAEVREAAESVRAAAGDTRVEVEWGDVFLPATVARLERDAILRDAKLRDQVIGHLFDELSEAVLERSFLFQLLQRYRPEAVVDCINTATAFAYQNVYGSARQLVRQASEGGVTREVAERHLLTLPIPQLIRHTQIAAEGLRRAGTRGYVKIGTSGTGGMGFNVPYTHSEERPSRMMLTKAALGGAQSLLLFLLARTPGAPAAIEIKPTATIGWREIRYGPIRRGGRPVRRVDCAAPLPLAGAFAPEARGWSDTGRALESVYIDMGENGAFARQEFETVTTLGSMELITAEEIADLVALELEGRPTGRDVVAALDGATAGPTYRAGMLRAAAVERLRALEAECGVRSIAFEMLGPPRLTKLLYEAQIWSEVCSTVNGLARQSADELSRLGAERIARDADLRSMILSVGIPIVVAGDRLYRGEVVVVPPEDGDADRAAFRGWVDLRLANAGTWIARARRVIEQFQARGREQGSGSDLDWVAMTPEDTITPSRFAAWIFRHEEGGERIKR